MQKDTDFYKHLDVTWVSKEDFNTNLETYYGALSNIDYFDLEEKETLLEHKFYPLTDEAKQNGLTALRAKLNTFYNLCDDKKEDGYLKAYFKEGTDSTKTLIFIPFFHSHFTLNMDFLSALMEEANYNILMLDGNEFFFNEHSLSREEMESSFESSLTTLLSDFELEQTEKNFFVLCFSALFTRAYFLNNSDNYNKLIYYAPMLNQVVKDRQVPTSVLSEAGDMLPVSIIYHLFALLYPDKIITDGPTPVEMTEFNNRAFCAFYSDFEEELISDLDGLHDLYLIETEDDKVLPSENALASLFDEDKKAMISSESGLHANFLFQEAAITEAIEALKTFGVW